MVGAFNGALHDRMADRPGRHPRSETIRERSREMSKSIFFRTLILSTALAASGPVLGIEAARAQTAERSPGQILYDEGVSLKADYTGEAASNPSGGARQSTDYAGQIHLGADLDLDKLLNAEGTSAHVDLVQRHGRSLSNDAIRNNTSVQEIYGTQDAHLATLTIEQKLFNDRVDVTAGRTEGNTVFLHSPLYCNFQSNSTCGNPTLIFKDSNLAGWPSSSWGGDIKGKMTEKLYLHAGAYEVNPYDGLTGRSYGLDFRTDHATGVMVPFELGYETNFANDDLPRHVQIGGWYDDSDYDDPLLDTHGNYSVLTGQSAATDHGRSGAYIHVDQTVWRPDPNSRRNLAVFGVAMTSVSGRVTEGQYYEVGLLQTGTFANRDQDTLGFVVNDQEFSNLALDSIRAARVSAGGSGSVPRREVMMELAYGAQVTPSIRLSPNLQYIINPDQQADPYRTKAIPDAFVVGFKFVIDLAKITGLAAPEQ